MFLVHSSVPQTTSFSSRVFSFLCHSLTSGSAQEHAASPMGVAPCWCTAASSSSFKISHRCQLTHKAFPIYLPFLPGGTIFLLCDPPYSSLIFTVIK